MSGVWKGGDNMYRVYSTGRLVLETESIYAAFDRALFEHAWGEVAEILDESGKSIPFIPD